MQRPKANMSPSPADQWGSTGEGPKILLEPQFRKPTSEPYFKLKNSTNE